jgi:hypothetical protein
MYCASRKSRDNTDCGWLCRLIADRAFLVLPAHHANPRITRTDTLALHNKMLNAMHIFASSELSVLFAAAVVFCFLDVLDAFQHDRE